MSQEVQKLLSQITTKIREMRTVKPPIKTPEKKPKGGK